MLLPQSDILSLSLSPLPHTQWNRTSGEEKSRIEIHFLSLGRNGKLEDYVLKWLSLLSKEQNTMRDPKNGVRGHFLAQLLSWCTLFLESFTVFCSFWGKESHFRTCSATFCVSWSQGLVGLQRTKNSLLIPSLHRVLTICSHSVKFSVWPGAQICLVIKRCIVIHSNIGCARLSAQVNETDHPCPHGAPSVMEMAVGLGPECHSTRGRGDYYLSVTSPCFPP